MNVKKAVLTTVLAGALLGIAVPSVFAQGPAATDTASTGMGMRRGATTAVDSTTAPGWQRGGMGLGTAILEDLTQAEIDGILYMREEEKLAHDVYMALYAQWDVEEFNTIANSEQRHADSVLRQLDRYGIEDPTIGLAAGEFKNTELQALYNQLIAQGSESLEAALRVGTAIEEIDILDLEEQMAETDNAALVRLYDNLNRRIPQPPALLRGAAGDEGVTYTPEYLDADAYGAIVSVANEQGSGRGAGSSTAGSAACDETGARMQTPA